MALRALVTGGTGFIGSHLVQTLISRNWQITCLIRPTSRTGLLNKLPVQLVVHDTDDAESLRKAVEGQEYIFHLAARIRSASPLVYDLANFQLTRNLVRACLERNPGVRRFVYVSSIAAAGPSLPGQYSEESQEPSPTSEYGRTKLKGETAVREAWHRIPATIIRPPNVYGPRQQETTLLMRLINKRIVPLLKDRGETTSLIYIKDLIEGILQAALSPNTKNQIYYLTDGKGYSWRTLILTMKRQALGKGLFFPVPESIIYGLAWLSDMIKTTHIARPYFGRRIWRSMTQTLWLFSSSKAEKDFGFRAQYGLEDGIKDTLDFYK